MAAFTAATAAASSAASAYSGSKAPPGPVPDPPGGQSRALRWRSGGLRSVHCQQDELVSYELPSSFDDLVKLTTRIDGRIQAHRQERRQAQRH
ncbi:hypothetical protein L3Q82_007131 [Scortum barcoo]|uniref:Uncharacterized protein n=1 Tax=Scortum barcoo TaxID=214431 RepID=A0ACB8WSZ9_9TELE|nr:hypothetical protein L3Q82_007131 [Scortum barcoo]